MPSVPIGFCGCGCGERVRSVASQSRRGRQKGEPVAFVKGHNARKAARGEQWCGICSRSLPLSAFSPGQKRCRGCRNRLNRERDDAAREADRLNAIRQSARRKLAPFSAEAVAFLPILRADPCTYCGGPGGTIDHVVAINAGGDGELANLAGACQPCNASKQDRPLLAFLLARA